MPTPTTNKWRASTIYGNLSVRDLTNSAGTSVVEVASVDLSGNFLSRGNSTFTKAVSCNALLADINANNILTTKEYVDTAVSTGGSVSLSGTNAFTGNNSYNVNFPTSTLPTSTSITNNSIVNKGMLDTLYQSISGMSSYLTTATASSTYSTKTNEVKTNTANAFSSTNTFNTNLPTSTLTPTTSSQLTTKAYVDSVSAGSISLGGNNVWTGTNTFNTNLPTSTLTPTTSTQLTTKTFVDSAISALSSVYSTITNEVKTNATNAFTGTNTFNTNLPTSTLTPTTSTQLTTKAYVDSATSGFITASGTNAFTGTNTFNTNLPTSTQTPTTSTQLTTKAYVDSATSGFITASGNNAFSGTNTFNTNLPTSTQTPTTSTQLTTKTFVDSAISTAISALSSVYSTLANEVKTNATNAFTGFNSFNSNLPTSTLTPTTSTQLTTKAYVDSVAGGGGGTSILPLDNTFTGNNQFQAPNFITGYTYSELTSAGNFRVLEDTTNKTQYFVFICNGSPSFQTTLSIPTTTTMNYLCVGAGGQGVVPASGSVGTGGGGGAVSYGSFVMVGGTTYTITAGTVAGSALTNLSSIVGGTVNIVANGGKNGNTSTTSPVSFTGTIATASASGVISSTNTNGASGGQGRNDALTPNGDNGTSFPFRYSQTTNTIIQSASYFGSGGAGTKSGGLGSTGGGFSGGGIAGGSANANGTAGEYLSGGGGGATLFTAGATAGGAGSGIVIIYFTPTTFVNSTAIQNGIISVPRMLRPFLIITGSYAFQKITYNNVFITASSALTITLPDGAQVLDGDTLYLRKTSATAFVITIAGASVYTSMLGTNNASITLPSTTVFAGTVFQLFLVARKQTAISAQWYVVY